MKAVDSYLKGAALPLVGGVVTSLALTVVFWNRSWVPVGGGAAIVLSLAIATYIVMRSPDYSRWATITACLFLIGAVIFSASFTNSAFAWLINLPAWAAGLVFWAILFEFRGTESVKSAELGRKVPYVTSLR